MGNETVYFVSSGVPIPVSSTQPLPVQVVGSGGSGTTSVTANQGTPAATNVASAWPVNDIGAGSVATAQISVTSGGVQIVAARAGRKAVTIENMTTNPLFIGGSGVTISGGFEIVGVVGAALTLPTAGLISGIASSGAATSVSVVETF